MGGRRPALRGRCQARRQPAAAAQSRRPGRGQRAVPGPCRRRQRPAGPARTARRDRQRRAGGQPLRRRPRGRCHAGTAAAAAGGAEQRTRGHQPVQPGLHAARQGRRDPAGGRRWRAPHRDAQRRQRRRAALGHEPPLPAFGRPGRAEQQPRDHQPDAAHRRARRHRRRGPADGPGRSRGQRRLQSRPGQWRPA